MNLVANRWLEVGSRRRGVVLAGLLILAFGIGVGAAIDPRVGVGLLLVALFIPVLLLSLPVAIAAWFPLVFLEGIAAFNLAAKAGGIVLSIAWLVSARYWIRTRQLEPGALRSILLVLAALLTWLTLSLVWAEDTGVALEDLWRWYAVALVLIVVSTAIRTDRHLRMLLWGFVIGGAAAITIGIAAGGLGMSEGVDQGRLTGAQGDPNFLAAGIVPAMVLAMALFATTRRFDARVVLLAAFLLLGFGLVTSASRGGIVAALLALLVALLVFKRGRAVILGFAMVFSALAVAWISASPGAWERFTDLEGGSGRDELWTVAMRMTTDRPVLGSGLNNFTVAAGDYVREPGALTRLDLIVEDPHVVHSVYLQQAAEVGLVGLALYLALAYLIVRMSWRAARRFEMAGKVDGSVLARAIMVATIGMLGASVFISNAVDQRLWVLFALGVAIFGLSMASLRGVPGARAAGPHEDGPQVSDLGSAPGVAASRHERTERISVGSG